VRTVLDQDDWPEDFGRSEGLQQGVFMPQTTGSIVAGRELDEGGAAVLSVSNMPATWSELSAECHTVKSSIAPLNS
jgi:hypothetical protein